MRQRLFGRARWGLCRLSRAQFATSIPSFLQTGRALRRISTLVQRDTRQTDLSEYWLMEAYKRLSKLSILNELLTKHVGYSKAGALPVD